jgi:LysR family transcriptional regulator for bpeEF and oprC
MPAPPLELFAGVVPFVAIADAGSFRGAARQLGVTTSAVSKAITRLEAELGLRLLHRTSRRVTLTVEGEQFLESCRHAVQQVRSTRERIAQIGRAPRGLLRVSVPPTFARTVVASLPALLAEHPSLSVHVMLTDRFVQLGEENVDIAVRVGALEDSSYSARRVRTLRLVTAASRAYLDAHGVPRTPGDLSRHNCLRFVLQTGLPQRWLFRVDEEVTTVDVDGNLTSDQGEALLAAAVAGLGLVQAPDIMLGESIARGELREVLADHSAPGPPLTVLCAPGRKDLPKVRAFLDMVSLLAPAAIDAPRAGGKARSAVSPPGARAARRPRRR